MSETMKNAEQAKKSQDRATAAAVDNTSRFTAATKETIDQTAQTAQNAADRGKQATEGFVETMNETVHAATNMSSKAAEQGRSALMMGVRTAAYVGSRMADINYDRRHQVLTDAVHAMDVYRDVAERSAGKVQSLFSSFMTMGRGVQQMQHAWLEMLNQTLENAAHKPQDLLRCKSLVEVAEVQRDLYIDAVNHTFQASSRLLEMAGHSAQEAVRPLQTHQH